MAAYVKYMKDNVEALKKGGIRFRLPRCGCGSSDLQQHEDPKEGVIVHCTKCGRTHTRRASLVVTIPLVAKTAMAEKEIERITKGAVKFLQDGVLEVREGGMFAGVLIERVAPGVWFRSDSLRPEPQSVTPRWMGDVEALLESFGSLNGRMVPALPEAVEIVAVDAELIEGPLNRNTYRLVCAPNGKALRPATGPRIADLAPHLRLYEATHATMVVGAADGRVGFQRIIGAVDPKTRMPVAEPVRTPWVGMLDRVPIGLKRAAEAAVRAARVIADGGKVPPGGAWSLLPAIAVMPAQAKEEPSVEAAASGAIVLVQPEMDEMSAPAEPETPIPSIADIPTMEELDISTAPAQEPTAKTEVTEAEVVEIHTAPAEESERPAKRSTGKKARKAAAAVGDPPPKARRTVKAKSQDEEDDSNIDGYWK